ncbi:hypothetical protein F0562_000382 [Nyssa sinensis]|uniref:Calcium-transporting ATPase n=1 Tax=Nyssa sinensis TaxID=561372 RepID=A0A5J5C0A5_9ASTE|nr:hypothetical protein F0562_000382 [Nyssa sinensis]
MSNIMQASKDSMELAPARNKAKKRWHRAFTTFRCYKAFLSLAKKTLADKEGEFLHKFSRSSSYTVIDVESTSFSQINQLSITKLVREQNRDWLHEFGWIEGVLSALETNAENGIDGDTEDITCRKEAFGSNKHPNPPATSFFHFVLEAFKDPMILVLLLCAVFSLGFGIKKKGFQEGWYDGGSKFVAVLLVITVSAAINFWADREFHKMFEASKCIQIDVVRSRKWQQISRCEIVVGDIVFLETGDQVPADGLFLDGYSLLVDESSVTRQADLVEVDYLENPFLFANTEVVNGYARMLVTAVGMNTRSKMTSSMSHKPFEWTLIQIQLKYLTFLIGKTGLSIAFLVLSVSLVRYLAGNVDNEEGNREFISFKAKIHDVLEDIVGILATPILIASTAIPEGFSLAVTITLAYLMKIRVTKGEALLRIPSCHHAICSAITFFRNTLKLDQMNVSKFRIGQNSIKKVNSRLIAPNVLELLHQGVGLNPNPTQFSPKSLFEFSSNPTEKGICNWAIFQLGMDIENLKESCTILQIEAFHLEEEKRGVLIRKENDYTIHSHRKGAAGTIIATCSHYYETDGTICVIDPGLRGKLTEEVVGMEANGLRCIAFAHKQISKEDYDQHLYQVLKEDKFILLGFVGLENPYLSGLRKAVEACRYDGVTIRMLTKDNISTARAIAAECGILEHYHGEVVEGADFRNYMLEARMDRVREIRVMASASPFDKFFVVQQLKLHGHVVVTGRNTWDALLQSEADSKLCLGIQTTHMAKYIRDIVVLDDHIPSVVTPLSWGGGAYHDIQIFTQFQLTMSSVSLVMDSVTAISACESPAKNIVADVFAGKVPYPVLQLLWVKLIMSTLAAIALIREKPFKEPMQKAPLRGQGRQAEPLITNIMWKDIITQTFYQISILLTINFKGQSIFGVNPQVKDTFIFNTFVLFQVCNMFNARKHKKNSFEGMLWTKLFWGIIGIIIVLQVVIVECLKKFADTERLDWGQWGLCIGIAAASWPIGRVVKCIPTPEKPHFSYIRRQKQKNKVL